MGIATRAGPGVCPPTHVLLFSLGGGAPGGVGALRQFPLPVRYRHRPIQVSGYHTWAERTTLTTRMADTDKNKTGTPREPSEDVKEKQDPDHSEEDYGDALERATRRLADPSAPGRGSAKT